MFNWVNREAEVSASARFNILLILTSIASPSSPATLSISPTNRSSSYGGSNGELFPFMAWELLDDADGVGSLLFSCSALILASASCFALSLSSNAGQMRIWNCIQPVVTCPVSDQSQNRQRGRNRNTNLPSIFNDILHLAIEEV